MEMKTVGRIWSKRLTFLSKNLKNKKKLYAKHDVY